MVIDMMIVMMIIVIMMEIMILIIWTYLQLSHFIWVKAHKAPIHSPVPLSSVEWIPLQIPWSRLDLCSETRSSLIELTSIGYELSVCCDKWSDTDDDELTSIGMNWVYVVTDQVSIDICYLYIPVTDRLERRDAWPGIKYIANTFNTSTKYYYNHHHDYHHHYDYHHPDHRHYDYGMVIIAIIIIFITIDI